VEAFHCTGQWQCLTHSSPATFSRGETKNRAQSFAASEKGITHRLVDGRRRCIFFWQEPIQRAIDHLLTGFEIQGQIHVTECCDSMLDITFLMLDASCSTRKFSARSQNFGSG
jgi:hypothetical protein